MKTSQLSKFNLSKKEIASALKWTCAILIYAFIIYISVSSDKSEEQEGPTFFFLFLILGVIAISWLICKLKRLFS